MAVPKRKTSKMKKRQRRAGRTTSFPNVPKSNVDSFHQPHRVDPETGMYNGRQVLVVNADD